MNIERPNAVYVSYEVRKALRLLAKARSDKGQKITADELADDILANDLRETYPQLFEHQKKVSQLEKELLETL